MAVFRDEGTNGKVLILDAEEAGFLKDLLMRHVAGTLTIGDAPLGRVIDALRPVPRRMAKVSRNSGAHGYVVLEEFEDSEEEMAALDSLASVIGWENV